MGSTGYSTVPVRSRTCDLSLTIKGQFQPSGLLFLDLPFSSSYVSSSSSYVSFSHPHAMRAYLTFPQPALPPGPECSTADPRPVARPEHLCFERALSSIGFMFLTLQVVWSALRGRPNVQTLPYPASPRLALDPPPSRDKRASPPLT